MLQHSVTQLHLVIVLQAIIAERLSARQLILCRISFCVCMYVCTYVCMSITLRSANYVHCTHAIVFPVGPGEYTNMRSCGLLLV